MGKEVLAVESILSEEPKVLSRKDLGMGIEPCRVTFTYD